MLVIIVFLLGCIGISRGENWFLTNNSDFSIFVSNTRNKTGHWLTELAMGHEYEKKDLGTWKLNMDHMTMKLGDKQRTVVYLKITRPPKLQVPAPGYTLVFDMGYYKIHNEVKNWHDASNTCVNEDAHLLVLNSIEEARKIEDFIGTNGSKSSWHWTGFHDMHKEGKYVTIFNQTLESTGYIAWGRNEPTSGTAYNCGDFKYNFGLGVGACGNKLPFICEQEI